MGKLVVLMITAFIDMAGVLMVLPLLPFYAKSMGAGGFVVGALVSSFAVAQLLSAPMWGRFSDRYGRRPALLVGVGIPLDVDLPVRDAGLVELELEATAVAAPGGRVHRQLSHVGVNTRG